VGNVALLTIGFLVERMAEERQEGCRRQCHLLSSAIRLWKSIQLEIAFSNIIAAMQIVSITSRFSM